MFHTKWCAASAAHDVSSYYVSFMPIRSIQWTVSTQRLAMMTIRLHCIERHKKKEQAMRPGSSEHRPPQITQQENSSSSSLSQTPLAHKPSRRERRLCYASIFLCGWCFTALLEHLIWFSLTIPFSWVQLAVPLLLVATAHLTLFPELAPPVGSPLWREQTRWLSIFLLLALIILPSCLAFLPYEGLSTTWPWPWPLTVLLMLGTGFIIRKTLRARL